jgi:hypothetical protein
MNARLTMFPPQWRNVGVGLRRRRANYTTIRPNKLGISADDGLGALWRRRAGAVVRAATALRALRPPGGGRVQLWDFSRFSGNKVKRLHALAPSLGCYFE